MSRRKRKRTRGQDKVVSFLLLSNNYKQRFPINFYLHLFLQIISKAIQRSQEEKPSVPSSSSSQVTHIRFPDSDEET